MSPPCWKSSLGALGVAPLRYLRPLPHNLGTLLKGYDKILIPEINNGQLCKVIRDKYLLPVEQYNKIQGVPITSAELVATVERLLGGGDRRDNLQPDILSSLFDSRAVKLRPASPILLGHFGNGKAEARPFHCRQPSAQHPVAAKHTRHLHKKMKKI